VYRTHGYRKIYWKLQRSSSESKDDIKLISHKQEVELEGVNMSKKAIVEVSLVQESDKMSNKHIEKEILKEAFIPWGKTILKVKIEKER
jgi:hypothetical protein